MVGHDGLATPISAWTFRSGDQLLIPGVYYSTLRRSGGAIRVAAAADRCADTFAGLILQQPFEVTFTSYYFRPPPSNISSVLLGS
jgi:hypothetical protein